MRTALLLALLLVRLDLALGQHLISVETVTDQYGSETIWQIDGLGSNIAIGSGFQDYAEPGTYPQWNEQFSLPNGTYNICVTSGIDGLCCDYGYGSVTVRHVPSGAVLFATDSTFTDDIVCGQFSFPFGGVNGTLFLDADQSCAPSGGELLVPGQVIEVQPGPHLAITDAQGNFNLTLPPGQYLASVVSTGLIPVCPPAASVPFEITESVPFAQLLLGDSSTASLDMVSALGIGPARPGFPVTMTAWFTNASAFGSGPVTANVELDPLLTFDNASIVPQSVFGNSLTWQLPALGPFAQYSITIQATLPPDPQLIGQGIAVSASVVQSLDEEVLTNNSFLAHATITGSYDPNDKISWPRDYFDLSVDSVIDYTIRFQNTGSDTAFTVVITDTIAAGLDMATFQQIGASHHFSLSFKPDRIAEWRFADILLPDSNVNEPASHGLVCFRIKPAQPVAPGTMLRNTASIYFDFNPPVITEPCVLVTDFSSAIPSRNDGTMHLAPNPAIDVVQVHLAQGIPRTFAVWSIDGRRMAVHATVMDSGLQLEVRHLAPGAYTVTTETGSTRFVKQ